MYFNSNGNPSRRAIAGYDPLEALKAAKRRTNERHVGKSLLRIVKLTGFFLVIGLLQLSAATSGQRLSISVKNTTLDKIFTEIEKKTNYVFFYDASILQHAKPVTVEMKDATVEEVLQASLKGQSLEFSIQNQTIFIKKGMSKAVAALSAPGGGSTPPSVSGEVRSEDGLPLAGATVYIKKLKLMGVTNAQGAFALKNVPDGEYEVEITYVGFEAYKTTVTVTNHQGTVAARMKQSMSKLDETQVIAYGTTTQRLNTGDVTKVTSKEIEEQPVGNVLAALEGRVPGLVVTQNTGVPGGSFTVQIRGQNSLVNGNTPFFVIDGVPYNSAMPGSLQGNNVLLASSLQGGNPLNFINPYDIESIEILKDADATAIYGSRAANGAILITTKKGKAGRTTVSLNVYSGLGEIPHSMDFLNTKQYLTMRHEAFVNDGAVPNSNSDFDLTFWDTTRYTNWQKVLLGNKAQYNDAQLSVSGGSTNTQYLIGGGYHRETTPFPIALPGQGADQKASAHFTINNKSDNGKFKVYFTTGFVSDKNTVQPTDLVNMALYLSPDAPPLYNIDGSLNWAPNSRGGGTWQNPISVLLIGCNSRTSNLLANAVVTYTVLPGLDLKADLGYTNTQTDEVRTQPTTTTDPSQHVTSGYAYFNELNTHSWIIEPQVNYKLQCGKGVFTALLGSSFHENIASAQRLSATGFSSDAVLQNIQAATNISVAYSSGSQYKYNAVFGRVNYVWDDKYLLNLTARRDGSSRFGPGNQFANFGAVGAGWIFTRERSIQTLLPILSFGKLRVSYGTAGNDQIGDYRFLDLYITTQYPYQNLQGFYPSSLFNPNLAWEINKKLEGGIELGLLKDRILLSASVFRNRSGNQLVTSPVSAVTGFTSIPANLHAVVQNLGEEFTLNSVNIKTKNFSWSSSFNLTILRNKLISFPDLAHSAYSRQYVIGQPVNIQKAVRCIGVNDSTGVYEFADFKGNPTYNPNIPTDQTILIDINPKYFGGLRNTFTYKGLSIDFLFQFVKQIGQSFFAAYPARPGTMANQPDALLNRWQKPGDMKPYQQYSQKFFSKATNSLSIAKYYSDLAFSDASYIRLKNVAISWEIPNILKQKLHLQNLRIYFQGQNLLTITKYKGLDPESQGISLPPLKVYTVGLQLML